MTTANQRNAAKDALILRKAETFRLAALFHAAEVVMGSRPDVGKSFDQAEAFMKEAVRRGYRPDLSAAPAHPSGGADAYGDVNG